MSGSRDKIVFIVRSAVKCTYYTEVGFAMQKIAFLHLLTDRDVMINLSHRLENSNNKGMSVLNSEILILSCSFYVLKFSVHNVLSVLIAISFYSFRKGN